MIVGHLRDHELRVTQFNYVMFNFIRNSVRDEIAVSGLNLIISELNRVGVIEVMNVLCC